MSSNLGIVGGCGSSGTTLLTHLLSRSSHICSGPEFNFFNHFELFDFSLFQLMYDKMLEGRCTPHGYVDVHVFMTHREEYGIDPSEVRKWIKLSDNSQSFIQHVCDHMASRFGTAYFVEKTPSNVYCFQKVSSELKNVPMVHVIRDGRDVACSLMKRGFNLFGAGSRWLYDTIAGMSVRESPQYLEVKYENLVSDTKGTLEKNFHHFGLPFDPAIVEGTTQDNRGLYTENWPRVWNVWNQTPSDPISTTSVGRYKKELSKEELSTLYRIQLTDRTAMKWKSPVRTFGELLEYMGYEVNSSIPNKHHPGLQQRARELGYQVSDYHRRLKRFLNNRYLRPPCRYTRIV